MEAKYKVAQLWNHTVVCKFGTLIGYLVAGVFFGLVVGKGLKQDKCRPVKMSYLSRDKIGKTGKYWETVKSEKQKKKNIEGHLFLQIPTCFFKSQSKKWVDFNKQMRLALYPSNGTTIFCGFFDTTSPGWSWTWCFSARNFITKQPFVVAPVKIKDYTRTLITWKSWNFKIA